MPRHSSLKALLARPAPGPTDDHAASSSSVSVVLHRIGSIAEPVSVAQTLTRYGLGLRKVHQVLNRLAADERVPLRLPAKADVAGLSRALAALDVELLRPLVPGSVDVRGLREALALTQLEFATRFGLDLDAVQNWEQGRTRPDRNARILLRVITTAPNAVEDALAGITPGSLPADFDDASMGREAF